MRVVGNVLYSPRNQPCTDITGRDSDDSDADDSYVVMLKDSYISDSYICDMIMLSAVIEVFMNFVKS